MVNIDIYWHKATYTLPKWYPFSVGTDRPTPICQGLALLVSRGAANVLWLPSTGYHLATPGKSLTPTSEGYKDTPESLAPSQPTATQAENSAAPFYFSDHVFDAILWIFVGRSASTGVDDLARQGRPTTINDHQATSTSKNRQQPSWTIVSSHQQPPLSIIIKYYTLAN